MRRIRRRRPIVDKYKGRFDAGWDAIRQQWYERQKQLGIIPQDTELAPRNPGVEPWDKLPETQKKLALQLQEAFAGVPRPHRRADRPADDVPRRSASSTTR